MTRDDKKRHRESENMSRFRHETCNFRFAQLICAQHKHNSTAYIHTDMCLTVHYSLTALSTVHSISFTFSTLSCFLFRKKMSNVQQLIRRFEKISVHAPVDMVYNSSVVPALQAPSMVSDQLMHKVHISNMDDALTPSELEQTKMDLLDIFELIVSDDISKSHNGLLRLNALNYEWLIRSHGVLYDVAQSVAHSPSVMQRLMNLMTHHPDERLWVTYILINVTAGDEDNIAHAMRWGLLPTLFHNLQLWDMSLFKNICSIITNVAGTSASHRDMVLEFDPLPMVLNVCSSPSYGLESRRVAAWSLQVFCRIRPYPVFAPTILRQMLTSVFDLVSSGDLPPHSGADSDDSNDFRDCCTNLAMRTLVHLTDDLRSKQADIQQLLLHPHIMGGASILQMAVRQLTNDYPPLQRALLRIIWNVTGDLKVEGIPSDLICRYQNIYEASFD
jgi:hypothetical protein